jgi:hypothetical protein
MMRGIQMTRIMQQLAEGAAFGALICLILWAPHFI